MEAMLLVVVVFHEGDVLAASVLGVQPDCVIFPGGGG